MVGLFCSGLTLQAQNNKAGVEPDTTISYLIKEDVVVEHKLILGSKFKARNRTGSAFYISPEDIGKFGYSDVNRMLKAVPGVNLYEEDGFGLRPNISLRGTRAERSERITLMEDGVLIAPAPYSAPAAYYFPNAGRMHAVEVLKGSSQVQYGPFTTGGAINMVSTPIPNRFQGMVGASYGSYETFKGHSYIGDSFSSGWGYLVEYLRHSSKGFRYFENRPKKGFQENYLLGEIRYKTNRDTGLNHLLEVKFGYSDEDSDETYVGLSAAQISRDPFLRYAGSAMDNIQTKHTQSVLTYQLFISPKTTLTANAYYNYFHRNWYKLNDVRVGDHAHEKLSIDKVLSDVETNRRYFDLLTGQSDRMGEALIVRANNRTYHSYGMQVIANHASRIGQVYLNTELGLRYHEDSEDRFQWDDGYSMQEGEMSLYYPGIHGEQANLITSARAWSSYLLGKLTYGPWTLTAGVRYEDVHLLKKNYTKADLRRTGVKRIETPNNAKVLIPSVGIHYKLSTEASVFCGIHKGFAPPGAEWNQKPENSLNTELGVRVSKGKFHGELIGFFNNFSNMLGSDMAASGGTGSLDQFNVGKAMVWGAEFLVQYEFAPKGCNLTFPIQISYTYTDTKMLNAFDSPSWGSVSEGDQIPYINNHIINLQAGITWGKVDITLGGHFNGDMRTRPGVGKIASRDLIPAHLTLDASIKYHITKGITIRANAINLTNDRYVVSHHPSGWRAGHPLGVYGGIDVRF